MAGPEREVDEDEEDELEPKYTAALCISSEGLSAAEITRRLGEPTWSKERGEPITRRYENAPLRKRSSWVLESGVDRLQRLDEHLEALLTFVAANRDEIESLSDDCYIVIRGASFANDSINCSFVMEPELCRRLAELGVPLILSSY